MNRSTQSLILNVIFPSLFVGAIAGTVVGYFMAKGGPVPIEKQIAAMKQKQQAVASAPEVSAAAIAAKTSALTGAHVATASTPAAGTVTDATYPTPAPELIDKLSDKNWTPGIASSKQVDDRTQEANTVETLPDGATANRVYRQDGSLKGEEIKQADGSEINRSFFENGNVKIAYAKDTNGAATSVLYDSTGFITQQTIEYPDQTRIYSEYDDHGQILHTWRVYPDGHTEPYPPEADEGDHD